MSIDTREYDPWEPYRALARREYHTMQVLVRTRKTPKNKQEMSPEFIDEVLAALSGTKYPQYVAFEDAAQESLSKAAMSARRVKEALASRNIPVKAYTVPENGEDNASKDSPHWAGVGFPKDYAGAVAKLVAINGDTVADAPDENDAPEPDAQPQPEPAQQPTTRRRGN